MVVAERNGARENALGDFLEARARDATERRLAIDIAVGATAFIVAYGLRPGWWAALASAGVVLFSFGTWAVLGRVIEARSSSSAASAALVRGRSLVGWLGVVAALGAGFLLWTALMGTWIS